MNTILNTKTANSENNEVDLLNLLYIFIEEKVTIITSLLIVVMLSIIYIVLSQSVYRGNMLIQVENNSNANNPGVSQMAALFDVQSPASAEMEILRSRLVLGQAADSLKLYIQAEPKYIPIVGRWLANKADSLSNPGIFGMGGYTSGNESIEIDTLKVPKALEGTRLSLQVTKDGYTLTTPDDELLARGKVGELVALQNGGEILVGKLNAKPNAQFYITRKSRLSTIQSLQQDLGIAEKGKQSGIIQASLEGVDPKLTSQILNSIGSAYVTQNIRRRAAEAEKSLTFLHGFLPELKKQMESSEADYTSFRDKHGTFNLGEEGKMSLQTSADLQTRLLELQQKKRELAPRFQATHPVIKTIDNQIVAIKNELKKIDENIGRMPDLEQRLLGLMRSVQVDSEMYVNLLNSAQQLRLVKEGKVGNVRVIDTAPIPEIPVAPRKFIILIVSIFAGLLIGILIVIIRRWTHTGIQDGSEIEAALGLHVYATVPQSPAQKTIDIKKNLSVSESHVLATQNPSDPTIESLRMLRTSLQFAMLDAKNNILLFTGPTPNIGKSFTSVNFGAIMGAANARVLVIDTDMRKGHLNQYFGIDRTQGLSELIAGQIKLDEAIRKNVLANVDFIPTGSIPPNPSELLTTDKMRSILSDVAEQYDLVILDSGPVLAISDALSLTPYAGVVFLVARAAVTTLGELQETRKRIQQTGIDVKGVIFNGVEASSRKYGSKYGQYRYSNYNYL